MPHGESSSNALIYNASEVAGYLSGNDKDEYQRVHNALSQFFDIPENSWRKRGNLASGGPASYIEHFWVACQVQGITITPVFEEELKNARWRAGVRELPEVERYNNARAQEAVRDELERMKASSVHVSPPRGKSNDGTRASIIDGTGSRRKKGGIQETTEWLQQAYREGNYNKPATARREIIAKLTKELNDGVHKGAFTSRVAGGFKYISGEGEALVTDDQIYGRIKKYHQGIKK